MPAQADIEHLLRRTEYVARPNRVAQLTPMATIDDAVEAILAGTGSPPAANLTAGESWERGVEYTHFLLDRMAHDSPSPIEEKMGFFWHGHFCSELSKVGSADLMREQIDTFRTNGVNGDLRTLATDMSTQVAMLRYLDNNRNRKTSPNQNFARELMELFLLGVGNYTEADVEAATAAWTGHTDDWQTDAYVWEAEWHDGSRKRFLRRWINDGGDWKLHGAETIGVMLGSGIVPDGAANVANRGRPSREVSAEFISKKLWYEFAGTEPSAGVIGALRQTALDNDFAIRPWLKALLTHSEFYTTAVKRGLVRQPVDFMVALLVATGRRSVDTTPIWLMDGMGQRPLFPPNVSGWKHNGYWVNASAMAKRTQTVRSVIWRAMETFWSGGFIQLANGTISRDEVEQHRDDSTWVIDRFLELADLELGSNSYAALKTFADESAWWERPDLFHLIMFSPEHQVA